MTHFFLRSGMMLEKDGSFSKFLMAKNGIFWHAWHFPKAFFFKKTIKLLLDN